MVWFISPLTQYSQFIQILALYTLALSFELTFPTELWNGCQRTCDNLPRTTNSVEGFHNALQSSVTNMRPSIWKNQ